MTEKPIVYFGNIGMDDKGFYGPAIFDTQGNPIGFIDTEYRDPEESKRMYRALGLEPKE